jgi:Holliday junction resolvasome RuvABC endonuclease subunit
MRDTRTLIDAGKLRPEAATRPANERIRTMCGELAGIVAEHRPDVIVIEDTSGKVGRRHGGGGAGLAIHGKAVGYFLAWMEQRHPRVEAVLENEWTRGRSKASRQRLVALEFSAYDPAQDRGGDVSDAIALAQWWQTKERQI